MLDRLLSLFQVRVGRLGHGHGVGESRVAFWVGRRGGAAAEAVEAGDCSSVFPRFPGPPARPRRLCSLFRVMHARRGPPSVNNGVAGVTATERRRRRAPSLAAATPVHSRFLSTLTRLPIPSYLQAAAAAKAPQAVVPAAAKAAPVRRSSSELARAPAPLGRAAPAHFAFELDGIEFWENLVPGLAQ